jgi:hypothetical protein
MIQNVLKALNEGKTQSIASLAGKLDISEGLLLQIVEDLSRKGYLKPFSSNASMSCGSSCGHSGFSCSCCSAFQPPSQSGWSLTEKGIRAISK